VSRDSPHAAEQAAGADRDNVRSRSLRRTLRQQTEGRSSASPSGIFRPFWAMPSLQQVSCMNLIDNAVSSTHDCATAPPSENRNHSDHGEQVFFVPRTMAPASRCNTPPILFGGVSIQRAASARRFPKAPSSPGLAIVQRDHPAPLGPGLGRSRRLRQKGNIPFSFFHNGSSDSHNGAPALTRRPPAHA